MVLMVKLLFGAIDPRYAISSPYTGRIWQWFWELAREELALPPKMCKVMHSRMEQQSSSSPKATGALSRDDGKPSYRSSRERRSAMHPVANGAEAPWRHSTEPSPSRSSR